MSRYFVFLVASMMFDVLALLLAPVLPAFAVLRDGWSDNRNARAWEPRLPVWLSWFDTPDNSLWGDTGWRTIHCPAYWGYWGMVKWLIRNHGYGFKWSVLSARVDSPSSIISSGNPDVCRRDEKPVSFRASMGNYWQLKSVFRLEFLGVAVTVNVGWLLDTYVTHPMFHHESPLALFMCSVRFRRVGG